MCHFVTALLLGNKDRDAARRLFKASGFAFDIIDNRYLLSQVQGEAVYFRPTKGMCDCGTSLGSRLRDPKDAERAAKNLAQKLKRFRKKGWSEPKIETWLKEWERKTRNIKTHAEQFPVSAERWVAFVIGTLNSGQVESVGLLLHWYSGALDTERIDLKRTEKFGARKVDEDVLLNIEQDVLYLFLKTGNESV